MRGREGPPRAALILAGGAARGAYEVGVLTHLIERVGPAVGRPLPVEIVCGTSVGAVHACALAALADDPAAAVQRMTSMWRGLSLPEVLRLDPKEVLAAVRALLGRRTRAPRRGGILHPEPLARWLADAVPFTRIDRNVAEGRLRAVTVSATHVATGRTVVFVDHAEGALPPWRRDPTTEMRPSRLRREHAMASAAVPLLLPAVSIEGELYCDGGLRQLVPFSPAVHLGAGALLAVSPRQLPAVEPLDKELARERAFWSPTYLAGKAIDALLLDRLDEDVDRLEQVNAILRAGTRRWGEGFPAELNAALGPEPHHALHPVRALVVRASADIGELAALYVRSASIRGHFCGAPERLLRWMAEAEESRETDLLSYLLFDGGFAAELMALGRADATARHDELCSLLSRP